MNDGGIVRINNDYDDCSKDDNNNSNDAITLFVWTDRGASSDGIIAHLRRLQYSVETTDLTLPRVF